MLRYIFLTSFSAKTFANVPQDNKENIVRQYLQKAATVTNANHLKVLMATLGKLTESHLITAK